MIFPAEILQKVFSFLPYTEIYRLRSVCKSWKVQCEYHVYLLLKARRQKLFIKIGGEKDTTSIDMVPSNYDYENQVIEFETTGSEDNDDILINLSTTTNKRVQVLFSEWKERPVTNLETIRKSAGDHALAIFHLKYNPSLEQVYQLPTPSIGGISKLRTKHRLRYVGGQGMVMCFSYIYPSTPTEEQQSVNNNDDDTADPSDSLFIQLRVYYVHVTFSWIISGLNPKTSSYQQPIYASRYEELTNVLEDYGIRDYSPYSEPVLEYIMSTHCSSSDDYNNTNNAVLQNKGVRVLPIQEGKSKLEQLELQLKALGIDPRVIWKYTIAKNFILRDQSGSGNKVKEIAKVIQNSEEQWAAKKRGLLELYHLEMNE